MVCLVLLALAGPADAADKSGVSPTSISLPKGPGSIEGLGDSFQPSLNTGTAKHGLNVKIPPGPAGHQPSVAFSYEGGSGNGPLGYGWSIPVPHIQRQTDKGIPTYGEPLGVDRLDSFINESRELLVPTSDGFYFCENEGSFVRYRRVGEHWEGTAPNGTRMEFGLTATARIEDSAPRVFRWLLERVTDTHGNVIEYFYRSFPGGQNLNQKYLALVRYGPGSPAPSLSNGPPWTAFHFVSFEYENRPDWFEDARAGFLIRTGQRLRSIRVGTQGVALTNHLAGDFNGDGITDYLDRRYDLEYLRYDGAASHWSLLAKVTLIGADGLTALPPATFGYAVSHPANVIDASSNVWTSLNPPNAVMDNPLVDLIDLNADGLPDVLKTESGGNGHTAALNLGPVPVAGAWAIEWSTLVSVDAGAGAAWNFDLASEQTHLADMDGDGLADLVHKTANESVFYFANRGSVSWSERRDMASPDTAPPAPFGTPGVRTADIDFDKRIDVIQSIDIGGAFSYRVWFNRGNQSYSPPVTVESEGGFDLAHPAVQIADCNGDRVPDVARVQAGAVAVAAGLGYGRFALPLSLVLPDFTLDDQQIAKAKLADINGDGLADLVLERAAPGQCWYWLNLGNYTLAERRVITGLPTINPGTVVRWADLNGNGSTDLIYADSASTARLLMIELGQALSGGLAPNLLTRIGNGIGRVTTIHYAPSTQFALADKAAGRPWPDPVPFPVTVVESVMVADSLGHEYLTHYRYHDGYYDPAEKQFRGFANVEEANVGDATAPTLVRHSRFDTGRDFQAMKGRLLGMSAETEDGAVFSRETTSWNNPPRTLSIGTNGVLIRFAHPVATTREVLERGAGAPRRLEQEMEFDNYGNQTRVTDYGIVENGERSAFDDERVLSTDYALNLNRWIVRLPKRQSVEDELGVVLSRSEFFYDDENFSGTNLGEVSIGNLTLQRSWVDPASPTNYINATRSRYDPFGNRIALIDPLGDPAGNPAQGHVQEIVYDEAFHTYPSQEILHIGDTRPPLIFAADYDAGLGTVGSATDFNLNLTRYEYDGLGRLLRVIRPDDDETCPTTEYGYVLGLPTADGGLVNYIETRQRDQADARTPRLEMYHRSRQFSDGLGRTLMTRTEAEPAAGDSAPRVVVSDAVLFNSRQKPIRALNPHFTTRTGPLENLLAFENIEAPGWQGQFPDNAGWLTLDLANAHQTKSEYDATLRTVKIIHPDGSFARNEYAPLVVRSYDENDTDSASPHFGTPKQLVSDGLGRTIETIELVRLNDDGTSSGSLQSWTTRYQYDLNDRLTRITDSQNNVKELLYDGLKRNVRMNDPDTGISSNRYDAASNLIETTDAKGQRIHFRYDGLNRMISEDYEDENSISFSYGRTPDIEFHYDGPPGPVPQGDGTGALARNVKGRLAWVEDQSGEEHTSYDERGRVEWTLKRLPDPALSRTLNQSNAILVSYKTAFVYDPMDRLTRMTFPDHDEVGYQYNARGLLEKITGGPTGYILSGLDYLPSAQHLRIQYGNGTRSAYHYDRRLRLTELVTDSPTLTSPLLHFAYDLDAGSNIRSIADRRSEALIANGDPRRNTQVFQYDDLYRLTQVRYHFSPLPANPVTPTNFINYRYDRIGNMLEQTSDIEQLERGHSATAPGEMLSGGLAGRWNRVGRAQNDPPGPHGLTSMQSAKDQGRNLSYDANGNVTAIDGFNLVWDFRNRLVALQGNGNRAEYRYDYTGRRVLKKVYRNDASSDAAPTTRPAEITTTYVGQNFEVRDHEQPVKYVFIGQTRVAKITGSLSNNPRLQRLSLRAGWNLRSVAVHRARLPADAPLRAAYKWNPQSAVFDAVNAQDSLDAGTILWLNASNDVVLTLLGDYVPPSRRIVPIGQSFLGVGLEAWSLDFPAALAVWYFDATIPSWRSGLAGDLVSLNDLPETLAPGDAIFVRTDTEISIPEPAFGIVYYHQDHLGSSSAMTDADGRLVKETAFHPFGIPRNEFSLQPIEENYKFTQKERDRETAFYYFEARHLAPDISRFLSADPKYATPDALSGQSFSSFLSNPQEMNLYAYVRNNPLSYVDPSGLEPKNQAAKAAAMFDGVYISDLFGFPRPGEEERKLTALARMPVDLVNVFFGCSPANAPSREDVQHGRVYDSLTYLEHAKNVVLTFGGGKLFGWATGKIFGGPPPSVGAAAESEAASVALARTHRVSPEAFSRTSPAFDPKAHAELLTRRRQATMESIYAEDPKFAWEMEYLQGTKHIRDMMPAQEAREALQLIWKMADVIFSPLGK